MNAVKDALERAALHFEREARILDGTADSNANDAEYRSEARAVLRCARDIRVMMAEYD